MNTTSRMRLALTVSCLIFCATAHAQKMYRCGSAYQDRPCEGAQAGKELHFGGAPSAATTDSADAECKQRGIASQKIVWSREAGASADKLIADLPARHLSPAQAAEERNLIADVYQKRGSAPDVRAAIEADCVAAKKKAELAAALIAEGMKLQGKNASGADSAGKAANADAKPAEAPPREDTSARDAARRKEALCNRLDITLQSVRDSQRTGGGSATMNSLNQQKLDIESQRSAAGCR